MRSASWYCKHPACMHSTAHLTLCAPRAGAAAGWGTHLGATTGLPPHLATPALSTLGTPHPLYHHLTHRRSAPRSSTHTASFHRNTTTAAATSPASFLATPSTHFFSPSGITTHITSQMGRKNSPCLRNNYTLQRNFKSVTNVPPSTHFSWSSISSQQRHDVKRDDEE